MKKRFLYSAERRGVFIFMVFFCALLPAFSFALQESTGPNGSNVQDVHALGFTGQGIAVGLISQDHARLTHEAFAGINSNNWYDATDQNNYILSSHDTSVGGIICSRGGTSYPNDRGAAPAAELFSVKVTRLDGEFYVSTIPWMDDALSYLLNQQCGVVVTGIQLGGLPADGSSDWSLIYDYYAYEHNLIFATASGNGKPAVTVFGDTFNSITTGGLIIDANDIYYHVGSTSNSGPTLDERQKPDIAAPAEDQWTPNAGSDTSWSNATPGSGGQTSWAVPHTGGVAATLLSYADTTTDPEDNQNEVIKAVIVNSAFPNILDKNADNTINFSDPDWPWDTDRGYGRIDAKRAYDILSSPGITTAQSKGWAYDSVAPGQQDSYTITGIENQRLLVTLTWNRRVEWDDAQTNWRQTGHGIMELNEMDTFLADLDIEIDDPNEIPISLTSSANDNQPAPASCSMQSDHLVQGRPTARIPKGFHAKTRLDHLLSSVVTVL